MTPSTALLRLKVALMSSTLMERVERNLLKSSVTWLTRTVLEWQLSVTTVKTERCGWISGPRQLFVQCHVPGNQSPSAGKSNSFICSLWAVYNVRVLSLKALSRWLRLVGIMWWRRDEVLGRSGFYRLQMRMRLKPYMCKPSVRM